MATKNLGQVAGVAIQNTPPTNIALIWYDSTPSQMCHKVYDTAKKQWVIIDQKIISEIKYSELENLARQSGLPIGKFYQITDRNNTLALTITSTKVQYTDSLGNILIDDLGTNIQYHVSSSNLQIDDISGTFNSVSNKLVFTFNELENDIDNDYILGKTKRNNVWQLFKFKLKSLVSTASGNSITWNGGLFLNVSQIINNLMDKVGGFVSYDTFSKIVQTLSVAINNVGKENQEIIQNAQNALTEATKPESLYNTQLPYNLDIGNTVIDVAKGDKLLVIISKFQRYINKFKYAPGIQISPSFTYKNATGVVNNNDNVETAIAKLQHQQSNISFNLPSDWTPNSQTNQDAVAGEGYDSVFGKIEADRQKRNALETPKSAVEIRLKNWEKYLTSYSIINGMLEVYIRERIVLEWAYGTSSESDFTRFFHIDFPQETKQKISPFIMEQQGEGNAYNAISLTPLMTTSITSVYDTAEELWRSPDYILRTLVSFGYYQTMSETAFGLVLRPISKAQYFKASEKVVNTPCDDYDTFYNLVNAEDNFNSTRVKVAIPPMRIRYRLF